LDSLTWLYFVEKKERKKQKDLGGAGLSIPGAPFFTVAAED